MALRPKLKTTKLQLIAFATFACFVQANANFGAKAAPSEQKKRNQDLVKNTATRSLHFPENLAVGRIYFVVENKKKPGDWEMKKDSPISARGLVVVPASAGVVVKTCWAGAENLNWLQQLKVDDLAGLQLQNMPLNSKNLALVCRMTGLRHLFLDDTEVSDKEMELIGKLPNLQELGLCKTAISGKGFHYLKTCKILSKIDLGHNKLDEKSLSQLAFLPALRSADFSGCNLTDGGLGNLKNCTQLEKLSLRGNRQISARGLTQLSALKKLWLLDLNGTSINFGAATALKSLPALHKLRLEQNNFPGETGEKLKKLLPNCDIRYSSNSRNDVPMEIFQPLH